MPTTDVAKQKSNGAMRGDVPKKPMAIEFTDTQISDASVVQTESIIPLIRALLVAIGENPDRDGLKDTPRRVAKFWHDFIEYNPGTLNRVFLEDSHGDMVVVSGMRVWSLCEHHLLPFWCDVHIGYIPNDGKVLGLSKFARIAHYHAHKLQLQERLIHGVVNTISRLTESQDVIVMGEGIHTCMIMRGIETPATTRSMSYIGVFEQVTRRTEFLSMIK